MNFSSNFGRLFSWMLFLFSLSSQLQAQIAVNEDGSTPNSSAMLDLQSREQGLLPPRMNSSERDAINSPAPGLMIYNTDDSCFNYFSGEVWVKDCGRSLVQGLKDFPPTGMSSTGDNAGYDIGVDSWGDIYVLGEMTGSFSVGDTILIANTSRELFLAKFSVDGAFVWARMIDASGYFSTPSMAVDQDGTCTIFGSYQDDLMIGDTSLHSPFFIYTMFHLQYSTDGKLLQARNVASTSGILDIREVHRGTTGNLFVSGGYQSALIIGSDTLSKSTSSVENAFLLTFGSSGNLLWAKEGAATSTADGVGIATDSNGNVYHFGDFAGKFFWGLDTLTAVDDRDLFLVKMDPNGQTLWLKQIPGDRNDFAGSLAITADDDLYIGGTFHSWISFDTTTFHTVSQTDVFVAKYDVDGHLQWAKHGSGGNYDQINDLSVDMDGACYVVGEHFEDISFDSFTLNAISSTEIFVVKYDPSGSVEWISQAQGASLDIGFAIATNAQKQSSITGYFKSTTSFGGDTLHAIERDVFLWSIEGMNGTNAYVGYKDNLAISQDLDSDPINEYQNLGLSGTNLSLSLSNTLDLSTMPLSADSQSLSLSGSILSISNGNSVDLSGIDTDTDDQTLSLSSQFLVLEDGNQVNLTPVLDSLDNQLIQVVNKFLVIQHGNAVPLSSLENLGNHQATSNLQLQGNWLSGTGTNSGIFIRDNGFVGINTGAPETRLHLSFPNGGDSLGIRLDADTSHAKIFHEGNDLVLETEGNPNQLYLDNNGNTGIGINNPSHQLTVKGNGNSAKNLVLIRGVDNESVANAIEIRDLDDNDFFTVQSTGGGNQDTGKVIIHGSIQIAGGDPSQGDVLTSDDDQGNGVWRRLPSAVFAKTSGTLTVNDSDDSFQNVTGWTDYLPSNINDVYQFEGGFTTRLTGGTNDDDYEIRVWCECSNGDDFYSDVHTYRPHQISSDHNNFKEVFYLDYLDSPCLNLSTRFRLQVRNEGDDDWEIRNRVLIVSEF